MAEQDENKNQKTDSSELEYDFASVYANNAYLEPSYWDLKIIFGQLEQHTGKTNVDWHTAVTLPWTQSKMFAYWLLLNIAKHEADHGQIVVSPRIAPVLPPPPTEEDLNTDPSAKDAYEYASRIHRLIFGSLSGSDA